ncbi:MAG: sigma-70 family RNA polymerase sigma factor [Verrucomicrobiaceae bacterium]|nr:sigma-70 family RNA polymerase sigma factor [Verrucomicrobiaceae bacterium]
MPSQVLPQSVQNTRWSLVQRANGDIDDEALQALAALCDSYWYPVYAYIRRSGHGAHDAEDLTQGFFTRLLEKGTLAHADPAKGKLRTFLLTCVRNYLHNEHERASAQRRGAHLLTSFDAGWAEERFASEPADDLTPDRLYQRRWALTLLEFTLQVLEQEFSADGKRELFAALRPCLGFTKEKTPNYADLATRLGCTESTVKSHVFRLRQRWREILFQQVSVTLDDPTSDEIKGELAELLECV